MTEENISPVAAWHAAHEIAGKWLEHVTVDLDTIHRFAPSRTGAHPEPDAERPQRRAEIRVQLLNDKPRTTHVLRYSSTTLAGALEHLRDVMPGQFEQWRKRYGRASDHQGTPAQGAGPTSGANAPGKDGTTDGDQGDGK